MPDEWEKWDIWDRKFTLPESKTYKISLCTTCMDRLFTLKECLPRNILSGKSYPELEFVILDYNSKEKDMWPWLSSTFPEELENGRLSYYRTEEPKFYSMTHSRNVAFKLATGDIVNNVDADNFIGEGFPEYLNRLANDRPTKAVFAKGKRLMHGRLGFYKSEFIELLGGYDEDIQNYGYDDKDLLERSMALGLRLMWYGGQYAERLPTPRKLVGKNMPNGNWRETEKINKALSLEKLSRGLFKANEGKAWGKCTVVHNNTKEVSL